MMAIKYEVKSIPVWAFIKIAFFVNLVGGFILGLLMTPFVGIGIAMIAAIWQLESGDLESGPSLDNLMVILPIFCSFTFAFFVTLFEIVMVGLYNLFAKLIGGFTLHIQQIDNAVLVRETKETTPAVAKSPTISPKSATAAAEQNKNLHDAPPPPPPPVVDSKTTPEIKPMPPVETKPEKVEIQDMTDKPVRVRIAPSPSGYLHVGTARMAIANYLYARHTGGQFLVRIENTDTERSDESLIEPIISALAWLGIKSDEEIVFQSDRIELYKKYAQNILDNGHGYRCFCTPDELAAMREEQMKNKGPLQYNRKCLHLSQVEIDRKLAAGESYTIRLKIPDGVTTFNDLVSHELKRDNTEIEDLIIARSDGTATYNLAVVVDDHDMGITHVIRGNDHITNTFKQIHIYHALGFDIPVFGHVPMILRPDKKKVSKRYGDKDVAQYREEGILPEAMFNFLSLLGWSPKTDREIYTVDELIKIFNPHNFNTSNAIFDEEKLEAFNKEHIMMKSDHELATQVAPLLVDAGYTTKYWLETRWEFLRGIVEVLKPRVRRVSDFVDMSKYFFDFDYKYDEIADEKNFTPESKDILNELAERFEKIDSFTKDAAEEALSTMAAEKELKKGQLIHPTRLAVSGVPHGPGLYDILSLLGKEEVVKRMKKAVEYINNK